MSDSKELGAVFFSGHDWANLDRLDALCKFKFLISDDFNVGQDAVPGNNARCGYFCSFLRGPALDWAAAIAVSSPDTLNSYPGFVEACRQHFGVSSETLQIQRRGELNGLKWGTDPTIFFAEFDRLTHLLGITADEAKITHVEARLPKEVKQLLAEQALIFNNYSTMRTRLITMYALGALGGKHGKVLTVCSNCGKKGHQTSDCRSKN